MKFSSVLVLLAAMVIAGASQPVRAESEISVFGGLQGAPHSRVTVPGDTSFLAEWEGKSFEMPPYYGVRFTQWFDKNWGAALSFVHAKVYGSEETRFDNDFAVMEFTDGINPLTVLGIYRFDQKYMGFQPYVGAGAGISIPHVELQREVPDNLTFGYQYGGPVATFLVGAKYPIAQNWAIIAEYQFHYYWLDVDMETATDPDSFKSNIITNAINFGVSYSW